MLKLASVLLITTATAHAGVTSEAVTRPHNGAWQIACMAVTIRHGRIVRESLTMPWQGSFTSRAAAESYARDNVDCD